MPPPETSSPTLCLVTTFIWNRAISFEFCPNDRYTLLDDFNTWLTCILSPCLIIYSSLLRVSVIQWTPKHIIVINKFYHFLGNRFSTLHHSTSFIKLLNLSQHPIVQFILQGPQQVFSIHNYFKNYILLLLLTLAIKFLLSTLSFFHFFTFLLTYVNILTMKNITLWYFNMSIVYSFSCTFSN